MYQRQKEFLVRAAYTAVWIALVSLLVRYALWWLLPFLIALTLSALVEPAIDFCRRKMRFKRSFTAALLTLTLLLGLTAAVWLVLEQLLGQAVSLLTELPSSSPISPSFWTNWRCGSTASAPPVPPPCGRGWRRVWPC